LAEKSYFDVVQCDFPIIQTLKSIQPDYIVIGESTGGKLNIGQRGRLELEITAFGISKHSAKGKTVYNAIEQAAEVVKIIEEKFEETEDELLGKRIVVPTDIKIPVGGGGGLDGRGGNSTVPNKVIINYDMRTLVQDTEESVINMMNNLFKGMQDKYGSKYSNYRLPEVKFASDGIRTYTGVLIEQIKFAPAWKMEKTTELVEKSVKGLKNATGRDVELAAYTFCTDGSAIVKYRKLFPDKKIEAVGYGPGTEDLAHIANEYVPISDIEMVFKGYMGILNEVLNKV